MTRYNIPNAKDLYQETACRALSNAALYRERGAIGAWIYTIMFHIFQNECKRGAKVVSDAEPADFLIRDIAPAPDELYALNEISLAIASIKNEKERIMMTRWIQGYTYAEIAKELNMNLCRDCQRVEHEVGYRKKRHIPPENLYQSVAEIKNITTHSLCRRNKTRQSTQLI